MQKPISEYFHHSYVAQQREQRRRETVRSFAMAALVAVMFFMGCVVGYLCK